VPVGSQLPEQSNKSSVPYGWVLGTLKELAVTFITLALSSQKMTMAFWPFHTPPGEVGVLV
jgi:hypothetical protein